MTISLEETTTEINEMGYITATPQRLPVPSFYKLGDGTVLSVMTRVNHLLQNPLDPNNVATNFTKDLHAFVSRRNRNPAGKKISQSADIASSIVDNDVECTPLREEFNAYDLSNGAVMSIKTVVGQVRKTDLYNEEGEPVYNVDSQPVIKFLK